MKSKGEAMKALMKTIQILRKTTRVQVFTASAIVLGLSLGLIAIDINPGDLISYVFVISLLTTGALFGTGAKKSGKKK